MEGTSAHSNQLWTKVLIAICLMLKVVIHSVTPRESVTDFFRHRSSTEHNTKKNIIILEEISRTKEVKINSWLKLTLGQLSVDFKTLTLIKSTIKWWALNLDQPQWQFSHKQQSTTVDGKWCRTLNSSKMSKTSNLEIFIKIWNI